MNIEYTYFDEIDSTNKWAEKNIKKIEGIVSIITKKQTDGIGRNNRKWISPQGNLYMTTCIPINLSDNIESLPLIVCLSMMQVLEKKYKNTNFKVKWPNDIILNSKKIGGVLINLIEKAVGDYYSLIGIGININTDIVVEDRLLFPSSSIAKELGIEKNIDILELGKEINKILIKNIEIFKYEGFSVFKNEYINKIIYKIGEEISIKLDNELENVIYKGITEMGTLKYELNSKEYIMYYGDIEQNGKE
jgi:BirA family biotin operon repressor/biotin-[acetyl-CoA-carboxylase] ligase